MTQNNQFDYNDLIEEGQHEESVDTGFRRINYYNKDLNLREGTPVGYGGFGVEVASGVSIPPFGAVAKINHKDPKGKVTQIDEMVSRSIEVAIIGVSQPYTQYWPDGIMARSPILTERYFKAPDVPGVTEEDRKKKARGGISLFVVMKCDTDRKVWELPVRTFNVENALAIISQVDRACRGLKKHFINNGFEMRGEFMRYAVWVTLEAGETIMVGSGTQGNCTKMIAKWPKPDMGPSDFFELRVSPADYRQFKELRRSLDDMIAGGYRKPVPFSEVPALEAEYIKKAAQLPPSGQNRQQLPAGNAPARKSFDTEKIAGGDYRLAAWLKVKGETGITDLDDLIGVATRDPEYHLENALADLGYDSLAGVPPNMILKDFIRKIIVAYRMDRAVNQVAPPAEQIHF